MSKTLSNKVNLVAKASVVTPGKTEFKALASSINSKFGIDVKPQMDLLYVRSCLVTAGNKGGVNQNDDIFTREETWAARHTPLIKPANWQHEEKDIVGVVFSVEARDLEGNVLNFDSDEVPECEFEFWTEAAIFKLIQPEFAHEIQRRAEANNLFVSMEAWFDDYSYGICDEEGSLEKVVARSSETAFLDDFLRARGGTGFYEKKKIGRVLGKVTFGGYGFVDTPANKRSLISDVGNITASKPENEYNVVHNMVRQAIERLENNEPKEVSEMVKGASEGAEDTVTAVKAALDQRDEAKRAEAEQREILEKASAAEKKVSELTGKVTELESALSESKAGHEALLAQVGELDNVINALAGATSSTPPEIAAVDGATGGQGAFEAKIAWIGKSTAELLEKAAMAEALQDQLSEISREARIEDVKSLYAEAGVTEEKVISAFCEYASNLSDEDYDVWRAQAELNLSVGSKKSKVSSPAKGGENSGKFRELADEAKAEDMTNPPEGNGVKSGVTPSSPGLSTPRNKIGGSASEVDPVDQLEGVQADDGVNLAGASTAADNPNSGFSAAMKAVASFVTGETENQKGRSKSEGERPNFDPTA